MLAGAYGGGDAAKSECKSKKSSDENTTQHGESQSRMQAKNI